jgi:hypothetical protein
LKFVASHLALLLFAGCNPQDRETRPGTSVGNPGKVVARLAPIDNGELEAVGIDEADFSLLPCDGDDWIEAAVRRDLDLRAGEGFELPGGRWCGLAMTLMTELLAEGQSESGTGIELVLVLDEIVVFTADDQSFGEDGDSFVLELGYDGWLDAAMLERIEGEDTGQTDRDESVVVDDNHPLHDELAELLMEGSGLYLEDGDGQLDDEERASGAVASSTEPARDEDTSDTTQTTDEAEPIDEATPEQGVLPSDSSATDTGNESLEVASSGCGCSSSRRPFATRLWAPAAFVGLRRRR